jgi:hypothetical protein
VIAEIATTKIAHRRTVDISSLVWQEGKTVAALTTGTQCPAHSIIRCRGGLHKPAAGIHLAQPTLRVRNEDKVEGAVAPPSEAVTPFIHLYPLLHSDPIAAKGKGLYEQDSPAVAGHRTCSWKSQLQELS